MAPPEKHISELLASDPGLPSPDPTTPYWLEPPHTLAHSQSPHLPAVRDIVVIGSGITAASVTNTLLEQSQTCKVTVLEARTVCSGATGRNGGHCITYGAANYSMLKKRFGQEAATKIICFQYKNIERTHGIISKFGATSEYRDVTRLRAFADDASFHTAKDNVAEFELDNPSLNGRYKFVGKHEAEKTYGIPNISGAGILQAGALWPYRLVTDVFEKLMKIHSGSRLSLEANTPALSVTYNPGFDAGHPYTITTPRGTVRASHVIYCTNGYTSHLLPQLRGSLFPFRGSMTVQDLGPSLPNRGAINSWSLHHQPRFDPTNGRTASGQYYLQQNPKSGYFFFGGEKSTALESITSNDSEHHPISVGQLQKVLPEFFGLGPDVKSKLVSDWTGIMGYTGDGLPLVGRLPSAITNREGQGEWIAAGFNGMGMSMCILAGESIARKLLGEDVSDWFPEAYEITAERLETSLNPEHSIEKMKGYFALNESDAGNRGAHSQKIHKL